MTQGRIISRSGGEFLGGYWQSFRWMPHPELALHVRGYNVYFESSSQPVRRRELPSGEVALIISLGPQWRLIDPATGISAGTLRTFVAGLDDTYSLVESEMPGAAVQVDFTPIGARQLLQLPMHLVSKRTTELTDLLGSKADRLVEQLAEAPGLAEPILNLRQFPALKNSGIQTANQRNRLGLATARSFAGFSSRRENQGALRLDSQAVGQDFP